jgi:hypothetical protein
MTCGRRRASAWSRRRSNNRPSGAIEQEQRPGVGVRRRGRHMTQGGPPQQANPQRQLGRRTKWPWVAGAGVLLLAVLIATGLRVTPSPIASVPPPPHRAVDAREWQVIAKDPDAYEGERIIVHGHVTQFDPAGGKATVRANVDGVAHGGDQYAYLKYKTNTLLSGDARALDGVVSGDLFTAKVTVRGSMSYDTQVRGNATVPVLAVDSIEDP